MPKLLVTYGSSHTFHGYVNRLHKVRGVFFGLFFDNKTRHALSNLQWNMCKNLKKNRILLWFSYCCQKCMFVDFLLDTYILPIVFIVECRVVICIQKT